MGKCDSHFRNKHGVCCDCAWKMASDYAKNIADKCYPDSHKDKEKYEQQIRMEEFFKLTTPGG